MHAGFVLPLECADTYLSKHQSGSKIEDECNIKCHSCSLSNACASPKNSAENLESGFKFYLRQNKFSRLNKLSEQKGKKPTYFYCRDNKNSLTEFTKSRLFAAWYTLGERQTDTLVVAERKVTVIPFSDVSSFPFIAVYLADARGKCDEAAEHTYCKLRASGKLLVSNPPQNYQRPL